jgi:hypothetical protein
MSSPQELIESITDEDVEWVAQLMKLDRLDDARRSFLRALDTIDVSACPGSGKTTLVVAKLAILASKWRSATQGICVLSHTNVAREEIQRRLANTDVGHKLLSYPHYIDTIHGFVNRFLAIPWLLSNGYRVAAIDNDITFAVRRRNLGAEYYSLATYFDRRNYSLASLRMGSSDIADPLKGVERFPVGPHTPTYRKVAAAVQKTAEEGYFCHEEMFHFAAALLAAHPEVANILAKRFPFVLVDEMQDTSARQNSVLSPLFDNRAESVSIQRVGDANQAIYDDDSGPDEASAFPDSARRSIPLSSSFRFDQSIAALASGLTLDPVGPDGLEGIRVVDKGAKPVEHTIFVFPDNDASLVLPAYAEHVLNTFDDNALTGDRVTAIGCVHKPKARDDNFPGTVGHYWDGYKVAMTRSQLPQHLVGCLHKARAMVVGGLPASDAVDVAATGWIRLLNMAADTPSLRGGRRPHRSLTRALEEQPEAQRVYRGVLAQFVFGEAELTEAEWGSMIPRIESLVSALTGSSMSQDMRNYARWRTPSEAAGADVSSPRLPPNVFRHQHQGREVDVYVSSVHAVKGQTHLATLVLETFNRQHVLKSLMPELVAEHSTGSSSLYKQRMRLTYVAATRPSHLLCLALPHASLGSNETQRSQRMGKLRERGWRIVELQPTTAATPHAAK